MKTAITVCMGSSCFARGNQRNLDVLERFIAQHKLENAVDLCGSRCEGRCSEGPIIRIGETVHTHMEEGVFRDILERLLPDLLATRDAATI